MSHITSLDRFIPEEQLLHVNLAEPFPVIDEAIDIVSDLAGSLPKQASSISTAIAQSDWVFVPIYNEVKAIKAGLNTLAEVMTLNSNVAVIATKLQKRGRGDHFSDWTDCTDMQNIKRVVEQQFGTSIPVLPLKFSTAFDAIFEREQSIRQMMQCPPLLNYQYREVARQFDAIYSLIDNNHA